jgi:hypothetical protein
MAGAALLRTFVTELRNWLRGVHWLKFRLDSVFPADFRVFSTLDSPRSDENAQQE